jgi:predicted RND superfamily exporter protein
MTWREWTAISIVLFIGLAYAIYFLRRWLYFRALQRHHDKRVER